MKKKFKQDKVYNFYWPVFILGPFSVVLFAFGVFLYMHKVEESTFFLVFGLQMWLYTLSCWTQHMASKNRIEVSRSEKNLRIAIILFILSETVFFFSIFVSFFNSGLNPKVFMGGAWFPTTTIFKIFYSFPTAFTNILILGCSCVAVTWADRGILINCRRTTLFGIFFTLVFAALFLYIQAVNLKKAPFMVFDGVYSAPYFMATVFHGLHALIGFIFLLFYYYSFYFNHFSNKYYIGFEAVAWYWHFIDASWYFFFLTVYWWGA